VSNIVITGSSKGIGRGLAEAFVRRGHNVTVSARGADAVTKTTAELNELGPGRASGTTCDVTVKAQLQALWQHAREAFGSVDIWINNAGYANAQYLVHEMPEDTVHRLVDGNVKGTVFGSQVAINGFREQGHGALYNMLGGSFDGKRLTPRMGVYSATKAAIWLLSQYLVAENREHGVLVGMISPGMLISDNWFEQQKQLSPEEWQKIRPMLNILCDHVETAAPWLAEQVLENRKPGRRIAWLTGGKIMRRFLAARLGRKRDLFSRYGL